MKPKAAVILAIAIALLIGVFPVFGHHGRVGYDTDRLLTVKATVTAFLWSNPHIQIRFDAPDEKRVIQHWSVEGTNPFGASRTGWTKDSFKPGDQITITFNPAKNGNDVGLFKSAITVGGKELK